MVVTVRSLGLGGISGYEVSAECFLSGGLPAFDVVGLPDAAVREARERVRAAVKLQNHMQMMMTLLHSQKSAHYRNSFPICRHFKKQARPAT